MTGRPGAGRRYHCYGICRQRCDLPSEYRERIARRLRRKTERYDHAGRIDADQASDAQMCECQSADRIQRCVGDRGARRRTRTRQDFADGLIAYCLVVGIWNGSSASRAMNAIGQQDQIADIGGAARGDQWLEWLNDERPASRARFHGNRGAVVGIESEHFRERRNDRCLGGVVQRQLNYAQVRGCQRGRIDRASDEARRHIRGRREPIELIQRCGGRLERIHRQIQRAVRDRACAAGEVQIVGVREHATQGLKLRAEGCGARRCGRCPIAAGRVGRADARFTVGGRIRETT